MLWAIPPLIGAGVGAYTGYKRGGIPGALGGAVIGALPWGKLKAAGMGLTYLGDWIKGNKDNLNEASYAAAPEASNFARKYATNLKNKFPSEDDSEMNNQPFSV